MVEAGGGAAALMVKLPSGYPTLQERALLAVVSVWQRSYGVEVHGGRRGTSAGGTAKA